MNFELDGDQPFCRLYQKRIANNQDLAVIISDHQNRRGTGKTVLSLKLAAALDRTKAGITTNKVAISPDELTEAYMEEPKGSALVLDEAEAGLSKYEAASAINRAMRELVSMGRIREKYLVLNLPASSELDRDLKALCDFWYLVKNKGRAIGHHLNWNPYAEEPRTPRTEPIEWTDITDCSRLEADSSQLQSVYDYLTSEKLAHLRGDREGSSQQVTASELQDQLEQERKSTRTETRNELLQEFYSELDTITQDDLASAVGLSRSRVADILSE